MLAKLPAAANKATLLSGNFGTRPARDQTGGAVASLLECATAIADARGVGEGYFETAMSGVHILRSFYRMMANTSSIDPRCAWFFKEPSK